jgi:hypothetical protein
MPDTAPKLPVSSLREAGPELRRPFEAKAIKWKVQTALGTKDGEPYGGLVVCYMDRGLAIDRLNMVIPHLWRTTFKELERGHMLCVLAVRDDGEWIYREDVGEGGTLKARYSDAFKRVAVHFGVGVSLSRVPQSKLTVKDGNARTRQGHNRKWHVEITQQGLDYLRAKYERWLTEVGITAFGEPLLHGDQGDAQGDAEVEDERIIDDSSAVDMYVSLAEVGLLPRQQIGLLNQVGATIEGNATAEQIQAAVASLTLDQATELEGLIAARMDANDRERKARA